MIGCLRVASRRLLTTGALGFALALNGCAGAHSAPGPHRAIIAKPTIAFWSPALASGATSASGSVIPAGYSCAPKIWLPLQWGALPSDTSELDRKSVV
jgi:hypothetical protein